jgi:metallo-beta-lactamase family protein
MPSLTFLGASRTVTGSKYLVDFTDTPANARVLVDCGLFQGLKSLRLLNWATLPVAATDVHAVVLTHAHLDHSGYLPRLVAQGFRGRIFCTPGTADLCRLVLPDAGRLQEEDARSANKHGYSKHAPALPLFTEVDAFRAISQLQPLGVNRPIEVVPGVTIEFINAGHLLGSAYVRMTLRNHRRVLFGGDLGRYDRPILTDPSPVAEADVLLCESTYGDRNHDPDDGGRRLAEVVTKTIERGGRIIIPSFAIGRVEEVIYWLRRLEEEKRIPVVPVYVDSPMAIEALDFYQRRLHELDPELLPGPGEAEVCAFCTHRFQTVETPQESQRVTASKTPAIVISSSGMATGGRVLHHLKTALPDKRNTILFVGFQGEGTRGRALVDGAPSVKIHGQMVPAVAHIARIDSMSAHADAGEIRRWLGGFTRPPAVTYLVHGEPGPMDALKDRITRDLGWRVETPSYGATVTLE